MKKIQYNPPSSGYIRKIWYSDLLPPKENGDDELFIWDDKTRVVEVTNAVAEVLLDRHGNIFTEVPYDNDDAPALDDASTVPEPAATSSRKVERLIDPNDD